MGTAGEGLSSAGTSMPDDEVMGEEHGEDGAGGSALREYRRRRAKDEQRLRDRWGSLGSLAVALADERQSTAAWRSGAQGERVVAAALAQVEGDELRVIHDRRLGGRSKANIDHLVVTPKGVTVIDAKRYVGRRPSLEVRGGWFGAPRNERLLLGKADRTSLVEGVLRQVNAVRDAFPGVDVRGALCFVDADWPLIGGSFMVQGVVATWPKKLAKLLAAEQGNEAVGDISEALIKAFPPA